MESDLSAHYQLANNIDCSGTVFSPVGPSGGSPFTGQLDGQGYTIDGLEFADGSYRGLFGATTNAVVQDLYIRNTTIASAGGSYVGVLAGSAGSGSSFSQVHVRGVSITIDSSAYVGGIVGYLGGASIEESSVEDLQIDSTNSAYVGGITGYQVGPASVGDSYAMGSVSGTSYVGGLVGRIDAGPTVLSNAFASVTVAASSNSGALVGAGTAAFSSGVYAASSLTVGEEVGGWNFESIWYVRTNNYPGLRPSKLPSMLCEQVDVTDTTVSASCTTDYPLEGSPVWELQYRAAGYGDWVDLDSQEGELFDVTISDLQPGTEYQVRFRFVDATGTSQWGTVSGQTTGSSDVDGDGSPNILEALAPNSGDANDDGTPDSEQANVISYLNPLTNSYAVFEATNCTSITGFQVGGESAEKPDAAYKYPMGLASFHITCDEPGTVAQIRHYFYGIEGSDEYIVRKWMPDGSYRNISDFHLLGLPLSGQTVFFAQYQITDGGEFDDDGVADGVVRDPSGLAQIDATNSDSLASTGSDQVALIVLPIILVATSLAYGGSMLMNRFKYLRSR